jgi:chromosome segregation ATPase
VLDHKPWAVEDGQHWVAAFRWQGEPMDLAGSELTVGPDIAVELQSPGEKREPQRRIARRPRADVLESELTAARQTAQKLGRELHAVRAEHAAEIVRTAAEHEAELERVRAARATAGQDAERRAAELRGELDTAHDRLARLETALRKARDELAVARADVASQREELERGRALIEEEATRTAAAEVEKLRAERDEARRASASARGERDSAMRERDQAVQERDVWRSNIRTEGEKRRAVPAQRVLEDEPAPPVITPAAPDWSQPVEPAARQPARVAAIAALIVLAVVLALIVLLAL